MKFGIIGSLILAAVLGWFVIIPNFMQGSDVWCTYMDTRDKKDWSLAEAGEYAKSCTFRN